MAAPRRPLLTQRGFDLLLNNVVLLVSEASRGVILGTLFQYIRDTAHSSSSADTRAMQGYCIAIFSVGRLVSGPTLGAWLDRTTAPRVLFWCLVVHAIGQCMYALSSASDTLGPGAGVWVLYASRFVIGFGSGTLGVTRSVAANLATPEDRTMQFSYLGFSKFVGYALTPSIAIFLTANSRVGPVSLDRCTLPGWIMAALCLLLAVVTIVFMRGGGGGGGSTLSDRGAPTSLSTTRDLSEAEGTTHSASPSSCSARAIRWIHGVRGSVRRICSLQTLHSQGFLVAALFFLVNLVTKGVLTMVETIMTADLQVAQHGQVSDPIAAASQMELYLGMFGLVFYAFMVLKPRRRASAAPPKSMATTAHGPLRDAVPPAAPETCTESRSGGLQEPLLAAASTSHGGLLLEEGGLVVLVPFVAESALEPAAAASTATMETAQSRHTQSINDSLDAGSSGKNSGGEMPETPQAPAPVAAAPTEPASRCSACWQAMGPDADPWLLMAACVLAGGGALVASPAPVPASGLPRMLVGFSLIWSVGAPVADILAASLYSVFVSRSGGKQGSAMGAITAAGSLGRICFPLLFSLLSHDASMLTAAALCCISAAVLLAHYAPQYCGGCCGCGCSRGWWRSASNHDMPG